MVKKSPLSIQVSVSCCSPRKGSVLTHLQNFANTLVSISHKLPNTEYNALGAHGVPEDSDRAFASLVTSLVDTFVLGIEGFSNVLHRKTFR